MNTQAVQSSPVNPAVAAQAAAAAANTAVSGAVNSAVNGASAAPSATAAPTSAQSTRRQRAEPALVPSVDVVEDAQGITLYADLPGVPRELLNLRVDGDQLIIEAEMRLDLPEGLRAGHTEISRRHYRRTFTLSKELNAEQVSAELSNGVLQVRLPKAAHARPRKIQVALD